MRPEVTIEAGNHAEVNCLVRALSKEGHVMRVRDGFRVEVGGAKPAAILSAVQACLIKEADPETRNVDDLMPLQVAERGGFQDAAAVVQSARSNA